MTGAGSGGVVPARVADRVSPSRTLRAAARSASPILDREPVSIGWRRALRGGLRPPRRMRGHHGPGRARPTRDAPGGRCV